MKGGAVSGSKDVGAREPECLNNFHNILFERQHMIISGAEAARSAASTGKHLCGIMRTHLPAAGSMVFCPRPSDAHPTPRTFPKATPQACPEFQQSTSIPVSETTTRQNSMHNAELVETLSHMMGRTARVCPNIFDKCIVPETEHVGEPISRVEFADAGHQTVAGHWSHDS